MRRWTAGRTGLRAYRAILARADRLVAEGGLLALEVGYDQGESGGGALPGRRALAT